MRDDQCPGAGRARAPKRLSSKYMKDEPKRFPEHERTPAPPAGRNWMWRYLIWFFLIWVVFMYFFRSFQQPERAEISYTEFKRQIKQDNIQEVMVKGQEVNGVFKTDYSIASQSGEDTASYKLFATTLPSFEDPQLMELLEAHDVTVKAETEGDSWLPFILIGVLPWLLIIGYFVYTQRKFQGQMRGMGGGIFGIGKSRAKRYEKTDSEVRFDDVAGLENAKQDLREIIEYLKEPEKFTELGANIPKGILLMGPPGTGKTLLAKATAGEAGVPFFSISGSEFIEMFVGVGASRVRDMFQNAKQSAPAIIFIDEIDSVGRARGTGLGGGHDEREQTLNQILSEMDGFEPQESVVVMAATNRPDVLDAALTRPGRFDRQITLDLPQKNARRKILEIHAREVPLADDVDLENIAARTVGFSGADLQNLVNEAALLAGRKKKSKVEMEDFDQARDKILLGSEREEMLDEDEKKIVAYHEAGHALIARLVPGMDPLQKVSIIPRGRSLGATELIPEQDRYNFSRSYLIKRIQVMLGGRAAEKLIFDDMTNGAANDLKQVTNLARKMVCQWGMSEKLGPVTFGQGEDHMFLGKEMAQPKDFSEHTAQIIDEEIQRIIQEAEAETTGILKENRDKLERLAAALLENETLDNEDMDRILNTKPEPKSRPESKAKSDQQGELIETSND